MNNGLLYLGGLLALALAALFGGPYFIDWNGYRGIFEEEASKVLGRDVRVGGAVNVRFLPTPYVRFEKVRLADVTGNTGEPFLRAESFTMRLAVSPLLRGAFEANDIELTKPVLSLVLDGEGGGNWTTLELKPAALPFVPQNVALHAVRLSDGALIIHGPSGKPVNRVTAINGELSADTLEGPFKFKGRAVVSGETREFRLTTLAPEPKGKIRFKASMEGLSTANYYAIDGAIEEFTTKPRISGDMTGRLTLRRAIRTPAEPSPAQDENPPVFNLKSTVAADARGATFEGLELELDGAAEPQIITGKASALWGDKPRFDTELTAKWLDLDVLSAPVGQTASISRLKGLAQAFLNTLGGDSAAAARADFAQVKIGGELAGGLKLDAERTGDVISIKELKGGLPGGARFDLSGRVIDKGEDIQLDGEGAIRGVNIARVQAWAQKSGAVIDLKAEGAFWIAGHVTASDSGFHLTGARAELAGHRMSGDIAIENKERRNVSIRIETEQLDTAAFFPAESARIASMLRRGLGLEPVPAKDTEAAPVTAAGTDFALSIVAGELRHEANTYRDVDARLNLSGTDLRIPAARFVTKTGVAVNLNGDINTKGDAPRGALSYEIDAPAQDALKEAASLFGVSEILPPARIEALSSVRMAGLIQFGRRTSAAADVSFDGVVDGARLSGEAAFDAGFKSWRTAPSRINAKATTADATALLRTFGVPATSLKGMAPRAAEATLAISGLLADGAQSYAAIRAEGLDATLTGRLGHDAIDGYGFKGQVAVAARDAREVLALAGIAAPAGVAGTKLDGSIEIAAENGAVLLKSSRLLAGSSIVGGEVTLAGSVEDAKVIGALEVDRVVVASLLGWLTEREPDIAAEAEAAQHAGYSIWPEGQFNLDVLSQFNGDVRLKVGVLELSEGLTLRESAMRLVISPDKVTVAELKGRAAGGTFEGAAELEKSPLGAALTASFTQNVDLAELSAAASGATTVTFTGTGATSSPAGIISGLTGKGLVTLKDAKHLGPVPELVADASDAVFRGKLDNKADVLAPELAQAVAGSQVALGSRAVPFTVGGGDVKVDAFSVETPQGEVRVATIVSLASLALDSVWQVTALAPPFVPPPETPADWRPAVKGPLPTVSFVYSGSLGDLAQLQVDVDAGDLQRELSVRQMERKLEEMDALRHRDKERTRLEQEHRKAIEEEKARAAAAAKVERERPREIQSQTGAPPPPVTPEGAVTSEQRPDSSAVKPPVKVEAVPLGEVPAAAAGTDDPDAGGDPAGTGASVDETGAAAEPQPPRVYAAPRPALRPAQRSRRTTSDEINKAFGSWP